MLPKILSEYFDKRNKTMYLPFLMAFSSLSDFNATLKISITITSSFTLRYIIATTSLWYWKMISYNDVTSISIRNRSISQCKSNKKPMWPQYQVPNGKVLYECCCFLLDYYQEQIKRKNKRTWVREIFK